MYTRVAMKFFYWSYQKAPWKKNKQMKEHMDSSERVSEEGDGVENAGVFVSKEHLSSLTSDSSSKLDILGHDGHTLGVDRGKVGILEQTNEVSLGGLLEGQNSARLESQISLEVLSDLTNETLEGELTDQQLSALLITSDLSQSDSTRSISVGLLDTSSGGGGLAGSLRSELLSGGLSSGGLTSGLLSSCHLI